VNLHTRPRKPISKELTSDIVRRHPIISQVPFLLVAAYFITVPIEGILHIRYGIVDVGTIIVTLMILSTPVLALDRINKCILLAMPLFFLLFLAFSSMMWSSDFYISKRSFFVLIYLAFPFFYVLMFPLESKQWKMAFLILSIIFCVVLIFAFIDITIKGEMFHRNRFTLVRGYNPSWLSAQAGMVILLSILFLRLEKAKMVRLMWLLIITISTSSLILSQGRNAVLSLVSTFFALLVLNYFTRKRMNIPLKVRGSRILKSSIIILMIIGGVICLILIMKQRSLYFVNFDRFDLMMTGDLSERTAGRNIIWDNYINILSSSNWMQLMIGNGLGSVKDIYAKKYGYGISSHNVWILLMIELGLFGTICFIQFFKKLFSFIKSFGGPIESGAQLVLVYSFFLGMGNDTIYYKYFWLSMTVSAGLGLWATYDYKSSGNL